MKTTEEQRVELRRLADARSVLKWPELIDLLDDLAALEAENERLKNYHANVYDREVERLTEERDALAEQVARLEEGLEKIIHAIGNESIFDAQWIALAAKNSLIAARASQKEEKA